MKLLPAIFLLLAACAVSPTAPPPTVERLELRVVGHGDGAGRDTLVFYLRGPETFSWRVEAQELSIRQYDEGIAHRRVNYAVTYRVGSPVTFTVLAWTALDTLREEVTR